MKHGTKGIVLFAMTIAVMFIAGGAFFYKMTEFVVTMARGDIEGFGAASVATYLIGMLPLMFLTLWAVLTGRFRDIERPKFRMLELDREIERGGELDDGPLAGAAEVRHGA
ncbi:MAG TPA: hypothetical protein VFD92_16605 [Candidatus Binatia bacterium]|nr:hypothetical protein [Candidatus Binatia bacterium]